MPLDLPPHLRALATRALPLSHRWEEGSAMSAIGTEHPAMLKAFGTLSFRAALGLQAALGEWIHQRFVHLHDDLELRQLNEAVWAATVDLRYLKRDAMHFPRDEGSTVHGPLQLAKGGVGDVVALYEKAVFGTIRYLTGSANIVRYVLPDTKALQAWLKAVVPRAAAASAPSAREAAAFDLDRRTVEPRGIAPDVWGTPLPREAFDPAFDLASADSAALIDALLQAVAGESNPFLRAPGELAAMGFHGTPYRYPA